MQFIELVQDRAWALHPAKLEEINAFIESRIENPKYRGGEDSFVLKRRPPSTDSLYEVREKVGIIPVYGVLAKRMNLMTEISGGTSYQLVQKAFQKALANPEVEKIVLDIDSPGGAVDGVKELVDAIYKNRGEKPIIAYVNGMAASAAYWIASAADKIVGYDTAIVGSIGVALTHYDRSEADKGRGIVRTTIYAGKYKRIASDEKPLSEEGRSYLQGLVDYFHSIFTEGVARNRGITADDAAENIANGAEFIGLQAVAHGLMDGIGTLDDVIRGRDHKITQNKPGGLAMMQKSTPKNFDDAFMEYLSEGYSKEAALEMVGKKHPDLLTPFAHSEGVPDTKRSENSASDRAIIEALKEKRSQGLSAAEALKEIERESPELLRGSLPTLEG